MSTLTLGRQVLALLGGIWVLMAPLLRPHLAVLHIGHDFGGVVWRGVAWRVAWGLEGGCCLHTGQCLGTRCCSNGGRDKPGAVMVGRHQGGYQTSTSVVVCNHPNLYMRAVA